MIEVPVFEILRTQGEQKSTFLLNDKLSDPKDLNEKTLCSLSPAWNCSTQRGSLSKEDFDPKSDTKHFETVKPEVKYPDCKFPSDAWDTLSDIGTSMAFSKSQVMGINFCFPRIFLNSFFSSLAT